jgi:L-serine deaminase
MLTIPFMLTAMSAMTAPIAASQPHGGFAALTVQSNGTHGQSIYMTVGVKVSAIAANVANGMRTVIATTAGICGFYGQAAESVHTATNAATTGHFTPAL